MEALRAWLLPAVLCGVCASSAAAQETSTAAEAPAGEASLTAVGDIRLDGPVGLLIAVYGGRGPFARLGGRLKADIVLGNLECPLTKRGTKSAGKTWTFRAPPRSLSTLKDAGFNLLNLANNHVMDYGRQGLLDTLEALKTHGISHIGAGRDRDEAERLEVMDIRGLKVGFLGFTSTFPESAWAGPRRPGVAYSDYDRAGAAVARARGRCDVLVVSFHGGTEKVEEPNDVQKAFARRAVESGADLVIGHHPHVIQPLEVYRGKPILYSIGNFLFVSPTPSTRPTVAVRATLTRAGVSSIDFTALDTNWGRPAPAPAAEREAIRAALDRYGALSAQPEKYRVVP